MSKLTTDRILGACALACVLAYGCTQPAAITSDEQTVSGSATAARPSRAPATAAPTTTPTATPKPQPSGGAVAVTGEPTLERGRVLATFETRGLDRSQAREVVCYPTDTGDAVVEARFVLADASSSSSAALPTRFSLEIDMAMLEPATAYTLAYRPAGGGTAIETKTFTIPQASYAAMSDPAGGYTNTTLTFDEGGLEVAGEFSGATTWRHALIYDKNDRLLSTSHALLEGRSDTFTLPTIPGVPVGEEVTVYLYGDGRIAFKKVIKRAAPVGS